MTGTTKTFWPTAHNFAEAVQCPAICFNDPSLRRMLPAVDRLGMPLVTSGQFAYVFKLNPAGGGESLAVRCFRGFLGDRDERYRAIDSHLGAHNIAALPRFKYLPGGILVAGQRYPVLVMQWVEGPTLDVYLEETVGKPEVLRHLAGEWVRLAAELRAAGVAHGDLQHGNVIVERGRLRLVDLDGMFVPALDGRKSSEIGHQHYQHPARDARFFNADVDNFSALVIHLSLAALAERPSLWAEHHDENLLFTRRDFADPSASRLFAKVREIGPEHARLAGILETAARSDPSATPPLPELVGVVNSNVPAWITAPPEVDVVGRTREVRRSEVFGPGQTEFRPPRATKQAPASVASRSVQTIFGAKPSKAAPPLDPSDVSGNTLWFAKTAAGNSYAWLWWIPLHNFILSNVWDAFYVLGLSAVLMTFIIMAAGFLVYGLLRAFYLMETAPAQQLPNPLPAAPLYTPRTQPGAAPRPGLGAGGFDPNPVALTVMPVVGNRGLMIYHLPGCAWADKIPARQRDNFMSPDLARSAGFRPCRVCAP